MKFAIVNYRRIEDAQEDTVYLRHSDWDDWFDYQTQYSVFYIDSSGNRHDIGTTKVGKFALAAGTRENGVPGESRLPDPPESFRKLPDQFFSLGQDPSYYENLSNIGARFREKVLAGLRDIAYLPELLEAAQHEEVTKVSLLRFVPILTVREQLTRLAHGGARLTPYDLRFTLKYIKNQPTVSFSVVPNSTPPTNIHVVVGRNGVGKSTFLNNLSAYYVKQEKRQKEANNESDDAVSNLVYISFSAFDSFEPMSTPGESENGLTYHYVGLKKVGASPKDTDRMKGLEALTKEMIDSARACAQQTRRARWVRVLRLLESDPIFAAVGITDAIDSASLQEEADEELLDFLAAAFERLSSGHKIVFLTITRLVETVSEKSFVLLDEPEGHLHPPLLSAFVRALSELLIDRNGLAVIATHSPVVLQEVPKSCVWKFHRVGKITKIERPQIETFGENVGTLTNEVFRLEVTSTGFHQILLQAAIDNAERGYAAALEAVGGQLGSEGRSILRAMVDTINRDQDVAD